MKICPTCLARYGEDLEFCAEDGTELRHIHTDDGASDSMLGRMLDGRYLIEEKIGEGGMGAVYRGRQRSVGRDVAVKTLRGTLADTEEYVERFFREANLASTLNHPHCVTIYDFGQDPDDHVLFLAMEYLQGRPLSDVLRQRRLTLREALTVGTQICGALAAAHEARVVHRDLKPENVFLADVAGGDIFIKVLDFGIAKSLESSSTVTRTGQIFGTPAYMSPEQCQSADVDPRSDLYSLGIILYELVSGRPPFGGRTPLKTLLSHCSEPVPAPSEHGIELPEGLEMVIMRLLEKKPDDRYATALEVRSALEVELEELDADVLDATPPTQVHAALSVEAALRTVAFDDLAADTTGEVIDLKEASRSMRGLPAEANEPSDPHEEHSMPSATNIAVGALIAVLLVWIAVDRLGGEPPAVPTPNEKTSASEEENKVKTTPSEPSSEVVVARELAADRLFRAHRTAVDQASSERDQGAGGPSNNSTSGRGPTTTKSEASNAPAERNKGAKGDKDEVPVLTQTGARRIIASHNDEITACFEKGLLRDPDFGGRVRVRMVVAGDGSVANADVVESTIDAPDVSSCIVGRVKSWSFPATLDGRPKVLTTPFSYQAPKVSQE